jgi:hypothetical protein
MADLTIPGIMLATRQVTVLIEGSMMTDIVFAPTSWGEIFDKISILEIKVARLPTDQARANATKELRLLIEIANPVLIKSEAQKLVAELKIVNEALWDIENAIREHERNADFGADFVALARAVYRRNDERGAIKRQINLTLGSDLVEEKSYEPY